MSGLTRRNSLVRSCQDPEDQQKQNEEIPEVFPQDQRDSNINKPPNPELQKGWLAFTNLGSELLENEGSVARDHMASERTFLSWIRTSMGLATCGVGITQLFKLHTTEGIDEDEFLYKIGRPIGATFLLIAILSVIMGLIRFFSTQKLLKQSKYPVARVSVSLLVFLVLSVCIVTLVAVLYVSTRN